MSGVEPSVRHWVEGHLGRIELNRPGSLNALTHDMVGTIHQALDAWADDPAVHAVAVTGAGDRAFCAGGDIVSIHRDAISSAPPLETPSSAFWRDEYALNLAIHRYPKPYVPIMSGLVLGGGVGLSAHGSHRVVTASTSIGMPETGIGFIPDVGGTWLLSHAPGELGTHLGLTAGSVGAGDAILVGLADHFVPETHLEDLLEALTTRTVADALADFTTTAPPGRLGEDATWIDKCFDYDHPSEIVAALRAVAHPRAHASADKIEANSPTAVAVTLRALRGGRTLPDLADALAIEYQLACNFLDNPDFAEGIRAAVIDKDRQPRWRPATLPEISPELIATYFTTSGESTSTLIQGATT